jgi:hypothetical protein
MAGTWSLLKRIGLKKIDQMKESVQEGRTEKIDLGLPLDLRINGLVEISEVEFVLGGSDLKIKHPGTGSTVVTIGAFSLGQSDVRRLYLDSDNGMYMLQVVLDRNKSVEECKLFMPYDEVYPEDWSFWLADEDGYIGLNVFQLKDGTQYDRVWEDEDSMRIVEQDDQGTRITRIPPLEYLETIYSDRTGGSMETVKYDTMLYGRQVNESVYEYLMVSAVNDQEGASVQIMVGIELQPGSIRAT